MSDDAEEIDPSLDSLLNKYGASRRSVYAAENSEPSRGDNEEVHRVEQPSQFLQEIRERAEILSRNAAKARKVALQNVVNDDSKALRSTSANSSLDMFVDVIRSANITGEDTTSSLSISSDGEDFISSDDLLQPILPLDAAPWSAESPRDSGRPWDMEGSLDTGGPWRIRGHEGSHAIESPWDIDGSRTAEVPWKCESSLRTDDGRDIVESNEIEGPWKASNNHQGMEGAWNTENNDSLGDYGLSTEPWGTSTSQINDDITESEDSDTTSEESSDSQDDVDGSHSNISINSTHNINSLTCNREQDELASYERSENVIELRDEDTSLVWNLQTYSPLRSQTENADDESENLWSNTAVVDEEEEEEEEDDDEDDNEEDELEDDDNNDSVTDGGESISTTMRGECKDTVSSVILAHTSDGDLFASSPNSSDRQIDDRMSLDDGIKIVNEFDDRLICVDLTQPVSAKEDGLNDEDQSLCLIGKNIPEDEGQVAGFCDEVMDQQFTTETLDETLVRNSQEVGESSDAAEVERDKDGSVEVHVSSTDITAVAVADNCINPNGIVAPLGAVTEEVDGETEQFPLNPRHSFDTNQTDSTSNVTDILSSLYGENDGNVSMENVVKDDLEGVASSLNVEHSTCLDPLLPTTDVSYSANDDFEICVRNRDKSEETTNRVSLSPQPEHPSASNHCDLLLPTVADIASTVQDSKDGSIQDEMDKSTLSHSLHPESCASMESDTPLDSLSSVLGNKDGNILDVHLEEDVKTQAEVDKTTSGSHLLCSELLSALDQDDSESNVTASSSIDDDSVNVDVRTDLDTRRNEDLMERELSLHPELSSNTDKDEILLEEAPALDKIQYMDDSHKEDKPYKGRKDADEIHFKIQSGTVMPLIPKSAEMLGKDVSADVSYNTNNSNVGNSGRENLRDVHNIMLQKNFEIKGFEEDVSYHSNVRQSTKTVNLSPPNWDQTQINRDFTQDDLHDQTEGKVCTNDMLSSCSSGATLDSPQEIPKMLDKQLISSYGKPLDQDIVRTVKVDYKTEEQKAKKVGEGRHPEGLERSRKVNQHKSKQSVGVRTKSGVNSTRGASSATSGHQSTLVNQVAHTEGLESRETSSEQRGINAEGEDEGVRAGNVRNLIARFNSGRVLASDSSGSEVRRCGEGVSGLNRRVMTRLTSMEDDDRPSMHKESSEAAMDTVNQDIPWMQELAKRRKRRGQSSVWEKLTHQVSDK